jgi:ribonuclease P protein component
MLRFSRKNRLVTKEDFQFVFAKPHKVSRQSLLILNRPNNQPLARIGIIINKHFVKFAVNRNTLRRVVRESFRHHQEALAGRDIVVLVRGKYANVDKSLLRQDIDQLWQQLLLKQ